MPTNDLCCHRIQQKARPEYQDQKQRQGQGDGTVKDQHRGDVNVRVRHPIERRNEKFRDLRDEHENDQDGEENHLRPTTTKTSSSFVKSTAGTSFAWPSSSRTRKSLTLPINNPGGNTPPTPEV